MITEETHLKLTAYALGELDTLSEAELAEIAELLEKDAEARGYVKEIQETAQALTSEFAVEPSAMKQTGLTDAQRVAIAAAAALGPQDSSPSTTFAEGSDSADKAVIGKVGGAKEKKPLVYKLMYLALPISAVAACAIAAFVLVDWDNKPMAPEGDIGKPIQLSMLPQEKEINLGNSSPSANYYSGSTSRSVAATPPQSPTSGIAGNPTALYDRSTAQQAQKSDDLAQSGIFGNASAAGGGPSGNPFGSAPSGSSGLALSHFGTGGRERSDDKSQATRSGRAGGSSGSADYKGTTEWGDKHSSPSTSSIMALKEGKHGIVDQNKLEAVDEDIDVRLNQSNVKKDQAAVTGNLKQLPEAGAAAPQSYVSKRNKVVAEHSVLNIEASTPYTALLTYPPDWETLNERRFRNEVKDDSNSEVNIRTREKLEARIDIVEFQDFRLNTVLDYLRRTRDLNIDVDWDLLKEQGVAKETRVKLQLENASTAQVLKAVLAQVSSKGANGKPIDYVVVGGVIRVTSDVKVLQADTFPSVEAYDHLSENQFLKSLLNPLSTFSIDVDTASYANVRRFITGGQRPPTGAVRIEELINYFPYSYSQPADDKPFAVHVETHAAPWAKDHLLVKVGLKGKEIATEKLPPANIVFLIDVSGSMSSPNKLPLVISSLKLLTTQLREQDKVSIVVYAGSSGLALPATSGADKTTIMAALDKLQSGGSTNGAGGITQAYQVARENFVKGGSNRVVLMSDGDFNVGVTNRADLVTLIEKEAKSGVYLSIFGFGMGNYKDATLEELSRKGNGNYGYIDNLKEAQKALVEQFSGTMFTIAKDVKIQVEFNPAAVSSYRLIGYENRIMAKEDFNNDLKDACDIGAGHTVTALYEVVPVGVADPKPSRPSAAQILDARIVTIDAKLKEMRHKLTIAKFTEEGLTNYMAQIQQLEAQLSAFKAERAKLPAEPVQEIVERAEVDQLKYQAQPKPVGDGAELLTVKLRYKAPDAADVQGTSKLIEFSVPNDKARFAKPASQDFNFAASVAAYGMLLRNSGYAGSANIQQVLALAESGMGEDQQGHRADFIKLVKQSAKFFPEAPAAVVVPVDD